MSAHLMIVAGYMDHLPLSHKLALMKLCDSADDQTRVAYPGLEAVRLWSGTKKSRALEVMKDLQEWGLIMQLTKGHRGARATWKVFPSPGDEAFSLATKEREPTPGAERFGGPPGIPSTEEVKARIAAVDGKGSAAEGSVDSDPMDRVQDSGPFENGSGTLDPMPAERVRSDGERVQDAGRKGPGDRTPSVPASVPPTSEPLLLADTEPALTPPAASTASPDGAAKKKTTTRGTRLPEPFVVTDDMKTWVVDNAPHIDAWREHEKFIDHWRAAPGQKGVKLDWLATWRNWMRTAEERWQERHPQGRNYNDKGTWGEYDPATTAEQVRQSAADFDARFDQGRTDLPPGLLHPAGTS